MFQIFKLNDDKYLILKHNGVTIEGNKVQSINALRLMGCTDDEISLGLDALEDGYDVATYKDYMFIFCKRLNVA
jgi:hypothetical protein